MKKSTLNDLKSNLVNSIKKETKNSNQFKFLLQKVKDLNSLFFALEWAISLNSKAIDLQKKVALDGINDFRRALENLKISGETCQALDKVQLCINSL